MKNLMNKLAKALRFPDPIQSRITDSERELLDHQDSKEYHTLMVEWHTKRLSRLHRDLEVRKARATCD